MLGPEKIAVRALERFLCMTLSRVRNPLGAVPPPPTRVPRKLSKDSVMRSCYRIRFFCGFNATPQVTLVVEEDPFR